MQGIYIRKGIVTGINIIFGLCVYKTKGSYVYNKIAEKKGKFLQFYCTHNYPLFYIQIIQISNLFQSQYLFVYIFLPYFIINICFEMHNIYAYFPMQIHIYDALTSHSIQFHHTINTPASYPLKFNAGEKPVAIN